MLTDLVPKSQQKYFVRARFFSLIRPLASLTNFPYRAPRPTRFSVADFFFGWQSTPNQSIWEDRAVPG